MCVGTTALIFAWFNVRSFWRSTAIHKYLDVAVNGHVCTQLEAIEDVMRNWNDDNWLQGNLTSSLFPSCCSCYRQTCRAYRHTRLCAVHGRLFQCLSSLQQQTDVLCCSLQWRNQAFLQWKASIPPCRCEILSCSSPLNFDPVTSSSVSSKFCTSAAAVYYYGIQTHFVYPWIFHLRIIKHYAKCKNCENCKSARYQTRQKLKSYGIYRRLWSIH